MKGFHFRLFLRPTVIGGLIIERLTAPGVDRQAESRRWMELGFAAEQAGFRLDGAAICQADRTLAALTAESLAATASEGDASPPPSPAHPAVQAVEPSPLAHSPIGMNLRGLTAS